jgi:hypothetical protein
MPTANAIVTPQPLPHGNDEPSEAKIVVSTVREEDAPEATFSPETDDRWAHMPCTD